MRGSWLACRGCTEAWESSWEVPHHHLLLQRLGVVADQRGQGGPELLDIADSASLLVPLTPEE